VWTGLKLFLFLTDSVTAECWFIVTPANGRF